MNVKTKELASLVEKVNTHSVKNKKNNGGKLGENVKI